MRKETYDDLFGAIKRVVERHLAVDLFHCLDVHFDGIKRMAGERQQRSATGTTQQHLTEIGEIVIDHFVSQLFFREALSCER